MHESGLSGEAAEQMRAWDHSGGFSLDASVSARDRAGLERLLRYCARPPLAGGRLIWNHDSGDEPRAGPVPPVRYLLPKPDRDGRTFIELTPLEFLDRLAVLIPPPRKHRHRYNGVLAPNARLRALVTAYAGQPLPNALEPETPHPTQRASSADEPARRSPASYLWAALLARISAIAPALL